MGRKYDFELLLVRHGDAEDWSEGGDAQRALTEDGVRALERCVPAWDYFGWYWSEAIESPYLRAKQTAAIFHKALSPTFFEREGTELREPKVGEAFIPSSNPHETARAIIELGNKQTGPRPLIAVFGHNPNLSRVANLLVCGEDNGSFALGRGDVVHLFVPAPSPFDLIIDPQEEEPLPRAVVLGVYPRAALEHIRP
jgi:phosphohistidine phosphatase SixA